MNRDIQTTLYPIDSPITIGSGECEQLRLVRTP
jgi:hypothetical protein